MPSAATIVQDIVNGSITETGNYPKDGGILLDYDHSKPHCLRAGYGFFKCEFAGSKVHFTSKQKVLQVEGSFAEFDVDKSVFAVMDHNCKISASGFFSGCEWQIYRVKPALYYGVHVPRSLDKPDKWTDLMAAYAHTAGWTLLAAYPSRGAIQTKGETVWFVSQLFPNLRIDTVRFVKSPVTTIGGEADEFGGIKMGTATTVPSRIVRTASYSVNV